KSDSERLQILNLPVTHPEGWFFPDTYRFSKGTTDVEILTQAYNAMRKTLDELWASKAENLPYTSAYQALIMASIVEKETGIASERFDVAGVFVRRLKIGMRLQTDPTVIYGMGDNYSGNIRRQDLLTPTPYNTYTINGLPPTPIALPSKASIEAALHPAEGKSLYFVATGNGGHNFSDSLEQHNQAVARYLKNLRQKREQNQQAGTP
ncbi:MAG: endolytic transglycosylase MltG, partial [Moraxellaceae bacterium]